MKKSIKGAATYVIIVGKSQCFQYSAESEVIYANFGAVGK